MVKNKRLPSVRIDKPERIVAVGINLPLEHAVYDACDNMMEWLRDDYGLARNYYDRVGHFVQGFVPAIVAREILVRRSVVKRGAWLFVQVTATCLAISAIYEFIEWGAALATGEAADAFLGTQGDVWDTQWDMFLAFCGAMLAQLVLGPWHDNLLDDARSSS